MIREFIGFTSLMGFLVFGMPWVYYVLTGNLFEF